MTEKKRRGFAAMDPEKQREIASMGGKVSPANFKNDREKARLAGQVGSRAQSIEDKRLGGRRSQLVQRKTESEE